MQYVYAIVGGSMDDMYDFNVDDIGNRMGVCRPGNRYACYAANALNQHTPSGWFTYSFDQAKNVTELFDSAGGIAAAYDHGPFGEDMAAAGPAAGLNPFRFSSEVWDGALGLVCYNWRHYNPLDGRFISRDPIEERGGLNLYGFAGNDPVNKTDSLGLSVSDHVTRLNGLDWEQFNRERAAWGGIPEDIGMAAGIVMSAGHACQPCPENSKCSLLAITEDTHVVGRVFWAKYYEQQRVKVGYDIERHELGHVGHTLDQAGFFDAILHRLADGACINSICCARRRRYLFAAMSYYQKVARHYDAQMDDDDYGMNDSYSTLEKVEKTRQAMEDAMRDMVEKENEMNEKCK